MWPHPFPQPPPSSLSSIPHRSLFLRPSPLRLSATTLSRTFLHHPYPLPPDLLPPHALSFVPYHSTPCASSIKPKEQGSKIKDEKKRSKFHSSSPSLSATHAAQLGPWTYLHPFLPHSLHFYPTSAIVPAFPKQSIVAVPCPLDLPCPLLRRPHRLLPHIVMKQLEASTLILLSLCSPL